MQRLIVLLGLVACGAPTPGPTPEPAPVEATPVAAAPVAADAAPEGPAARGLALATDTHRLLPDNVGNGLNCTNCHLQGGTRPKAAPWTGVTTRYPKYRARSGKVDDLAERVNGCFQRSMNGKPLDPESDDMQALIAYMAWVSRDVTDGKAVEGIGMPKIEAPEPGDPTRGEALFATKCIACHQTTGQGIFGPDDATVFPPIWGERSYNVGAGMARQNTAAAFVYWNMPQGQEGTLTEQEAHDLAAYFIHQDRPDFPGKANDWPKGDKPSDARY